MAVGDAHVLPGFLTPVLKHLSFPKPLTTFLVCFCRGERRKYERKVRLNRVSKSQPPGHGSDTLTAEPSGQGIDKKKMVSKLILNDIVTLTKEKLPLQLLWYNDSLFLFVYFRLFIIATGCPSE